MKRYSFPRVILLSIVCLIGLGIIGERLASIWLEKKLQGLLESRGLSFSSSSVGLAQRTVRIYNLQWPSKTFSDSASNNFLLEKVTARRISVLGLLRDNTLSVGSLIIENGLLAGGASPLKLDTATANSSKLSIQGLQVGSLHLINTTIRYQSDSALTWSGLVDLTIHQVVLKDPLYPLRIESYDGKLAAITISDAQLDPYPRFYSVKIGRVDFDHEKDLLVVDSVRVIPKYSKVEFARARGRQSTWAYIVVPRIEARGFDINYHQDTTVSASHLVISNPRIEAFRDRRIPLNRTAEVPLPMKWLRELDVAIEIDSLEVRNLDLVYEHFAEEAFKPGRLHFNQLSATAFNVTNRRYTNSQPVTTMVASSNVMGGRIQARFTFPLNPGVPYEATGRITKLALTRLNPMLENAAFVSIESGHLNDLTFQFKYDNNTSNGKVSIDYEGLKVKGLKKDKNGNENEVKTLVANTALKNNNQKSGTIDTDRDKQRYLFHYWAISLMDGVRDAVMPVTSERKKK